MHAAQAICVSPPPAASGPRASEQVTIAVSQIDENTQQNAALVEESSAAAMALENQAARLKTMMGFFRHE